MTSKTREQERELIDVLKAIETHLRCLPDLEAAVTHIAKRR